MGVHLPQKSERYYQIAERSRGVLFVSFERRARCPETLMRRSNSSTY